MDKITLINAYGDKNIGDAAILNVAINFVKEANRNCVISVLCEDTKSYSTFISDTKNVTPFQLPYGYAIRGAKKAGSMLKLYRFGIILFTTAYLLVAEKVANQKLPRKGFYRYIYEIKSAKMIVGMGGGYFTTNKPIADYFGLILSLLPVYVAKRYKKKIVFLPMSFGPFASQSQERITYNALKNTTVISRDNITLNQIKRLDKSNKINTFYAPDLALFFPNKKPNNDKKLKSDYIVLTAREWFSDQTKQEKYEASLIKLVDEVSDKYRLKTVFVPMARNKIEDDDNRVAKKILAKIKHKNDFTIFTPNSLNELQNLIANARLSVCTRMHSAILSTTVNTPFIAIGYGHKTLGFVKSFGLERWHVDIARVNYKLLDAMFSALSAKDNYIEFIRQLDENRQRIRNYEKRILKELAI